MNDRTQARIVLGGLLALTSACKRDGAEPVAPIAETAAGTSADAPPNTKAPPKGPPVGLALATVGSRLFSSSTGDVGFALPPMGVSPGMTVDVVGEQDGRLVVETLGSAPAGPRCAVTLDGLADFRLRLYVAPDDLMPVRTHQPESELGEGTDFGPCREVTGPVHYDRSHAPSRLESRDDVDDLWGGLTGIEVGEAYAAHGLGVVGSGRTRSYEVKAGTPIAWADGRPAGQVTADHRFTTSPRNEAGRTCFDAPLAVGEDATVPLCFAPADVGTIDSASALGTIGLGTSPDGGFGERGQSIPRVRQAKATVKGALDKDIVRRIVRSHITEVRACYTAGLARDPTLMGRIAIEFTIGATGDVTAVEVGDSTLRDPEVADCIVEAVGSFKFPKPEGGAVVVVTYPFVLAPG